MEAKRKNHKSNLGVHGQNRVPSVCFFPAVRVGHQKKLCKSWRYKYLIAVVLPGSSGWSAVLLPFELAFRVHVFVVCGCHFSAWAQTN